MELKEQESIYLAAQEKIELLQVTYQPEDKGATCKEIAKLFRSISDYKDASELALQYEQYAHEIVEQDKERKYNRGLEILSAARSSMDFDRAIRVFERCDGYKDSKAKIEESRKRKRDNIKKSNILLVIELIVVVAVLGAVVYFGNEWLNNRVTKSKTIEKNEIGKEVEFGNYKWILVERDEETALMILNTEKEKELKLMAYNEAFEDTTWETSTVRAWLNGEFLDNGFTEEERARILINDVPHDDNETYGVSGGNDTQDYVYIPSASDIAQYYEVFKKLPQNWFLRTPGHEANTAAFMTSDHKVHAYGINVDDELVIRPMIRVKLQ